MPQVPKNMDIEKNGLLSTHCHVHESGKEEP